MKRKGRIVLFALAGIAGILVILFYGPFPQFRFLWINTAMYSSNHQFLATALYPRAYIEKILEASYPTEITSAEPLPKFFDSNILFAELKGDYYRGYIIRIEDPRRVSLVTAGDEQGEYLEDMVEEHRGLGGVNGAGYRDDKRRGLPWGTLVIEGEIACACIEHAVHTIGGFTVEYKLVVGRMRDHEILEQNYKWAFEFGPALIVNGEKTEINAYTGGIGPRTAIGQTLEGHILLVVIDGRQMSSIGATFQDVQTILYANGAINAICLDGGASSCMIYEGTLVNSPSEGKSGRLLPNAVIFR